MNKHAVILSLTLGCIALAGTPLRHGHAAETGELGIRLASVDEEGAFSLYAPVERLADPSKPASLGSATVINAGTAVRSGQELPTVVMVKGADGSTHSFELGKVEAAPGKYMVRATFEVSNKSGVPLRFRVGDVHCRAKSGKLIDPSAIGQGGSVMFTKFSAAEQEAVAAVTVEVQPSASNSFNYLFGSDTSDLPLQWSFRGGNWSNLEKPRD